MALSELRHFPDFVKLSHAVFALPFALAALLLASHGLPSLRTLLLVVAAIFFARVAAMSFNRLADAPFDTLNPRTTERHIPKGTISRKIAGGIVFISSTLFVIISFGINLLAGILSPVALAIVLGYSYSKRFTSFSHFFLGASLALAPLGAWVAAKDSLAEPSPWLIALAVVCWVSGFDIIYALQDLEFDRATGLHSMAVKLGANRALLLTRFLHAAMLLVLMATGWALKLKWPYFAGLGIVLGALIWENGLMKQPNQKNIQKAFLNANALASFGYLVAAAMGIWIS